MFEGSAGNIVIHIGTHKAASTTIQWGLEMNRGLLRDGDWLYPQTGYIYKGQHNLVWELAADRRFDRKLGTFADLLDEIHREDMHTTILSSEDFENLNEIQIRELRQKLDGYSVDVVVYLRRQDKYLQSLWAQLVKTALETRPFELWLEDILYGDKGDPKRGDYFRILAPWRDAFGLSHIFVRPLEKEQIGGNVLYDLLNVVDFPLVERARTPPNVHQSPSLKTLEIIRRTSIQLEEKLHAEGYESRHGPKQVADVIRSFADTKNWNSVPLSVVTEDLHSRIMKVYEQSNDAVAREYLDADELFLEKFSPSERSSFRIHDTDPIEIHELFCEILLRLLMQSP